jgi:beta-galactosidase/beta-glucuronidase
MQTQNKKTKMNKHFFILCGWLLFAALSGNAQPRPEYPRPQFERSEWVNLNGTWSFDFDFSRSGVERALHRSEKLSRSIEVPFCPESPLSGINYKDFIPAVWYQRTVSIPAGWEGKHVILHFGGVDYKATIYINGTLVFVHYGGSASFSVDISDYVAAGSDYNLVVQAEDDLRSGLQTSGKQSHRLYSYSCLYTRVTGIWQTVWMEAVARGGLKSCRITPDLDHQQFVFEPVFYDSDSERRFRVRILDGGKEVFAQQTAAHDGAYVFGRMKQVKAWSPEMPHLYDIEFSVLDAAGQVIDRVQSYGGMRKAELRGKVFYLNNAPYFQRLVLDQGYYPDGQWTAPDDAALRRDVELGKQAGFNGARLHQKVFEQRYFYWADRLGYLTWGESASWGVNWVDPVAARNMISEWEECVYRDYNAPSLIAWSPLNETWMDESDGQHARLTNDLYFTTKRMDRTRPVVAVSGGYHAGFTDIFAEHTYEQDPVALHKLLRGGEEGRPYVLRPERSAPYKGEAYMIDEFGGIQWIQEMAAPEVGDGKTFWGYGVPPKTLEEFYRRLEEQVNVLLSLDHITGFCYTQIVDVELEKNGIYTYDRGEKFDRERIRKIFSKSREQAKREVAAMLAERER